MADNSIIVNSWGHVLKLQSIVEYRTDGNHEVRPYYTQGARLSREILEDIQLLEDTISEGKKVIEDGKQLVIEARKMLPQLPVTMTLKKYFHIRNHSQLQ